MAIIGRKDSRAYQLSRALGSTPNGAVHNLPKSTETPTKEVGFDDLLTGPRAYFCKLDTSELKDMLKRR